MSLYFIVQFPGVPWIMKRPLYPSWAFYFLQAATGFVVSGVAVPENIFLCPTFKIVRILFWIRIGIYPIAIFVLTFDLKNEFIQYMYHKKFNRYFKKIKVSVFLHDHKNCLREKVCVMNVPRIYFFTLVIL
jgi:hypothetical protein